MQSIDIEIIILSIALVYLIDKGRAIYNIVYCSLYTRFNGSTSIILLI